MVSRGVGVLPGLKNQRSQEVGLCLGLEDVACKVLRKGRLGYCKCSFDKGSCIHSSTLAGSP